MFTSHVRKSVIFGLGIALAVFAVSMSLPVAFGASPAVHAQATPAAGNSTSSAGPSTGTALLTLAASIAIAGGLVGTGLAQSGIGAAGMGIIAERPEKFGQVLVFFVIPETLWIIGLVLGFLLLLQIL